jgi:predicted DNA-binding protein (MmcQ/YjbR family)
VNPLSIRPERLERLRKVCLALPGATEKVAWGDPTWRVRDRIFAMQKGNYAGGRPSVWLKAAPGDQAVLVDLDPQRYFVPPYVGHKGWVGVYLDGTRIDWTVLGELIQASHRLIEPRAKARPSVAGSQAGPRRGTSRRAAGGARRRSAR